MKVNGGGIIRGSSRGRMSFRQDSDMGTPRLSRGAAMILTVGKNCRGTIEHRSRVPIEKVKVGAEQVSFTG